MFTPPPQESKIIFYDELKQSQENLIDTLVEISNIYIPSVMKLSENNTTYTYTKYFGMNSLDNILGDFISYAVTQRIVKDLEKYIIEIKDPKTINDFKDALAVHLTLPQYYPNVPSFIQEFEQLHMKLEPLAKKLRKQFEDYKLLLVSEIASKESDQIKSIITQIKEEKKGEGNTPSLQRMALDQLLNQYLEKPGIRNEMNSIHSIIADELIQHLQSEDEEKSAKPGKKT